MKVKITFLIVYLVLSGQTAFAQFNSEDIKFWVGEGAQESYVVVDFRDGTTDPSFVWGFRYNEEDNLSFEEMIQEVAEAEPNFTNLIEGGFLSDITYNNHSGIGGQPDYWSTWSGDSSNTMTANQGVSEALVDGRWYGVSYKFSPAPEMPTITYPAYSSLWFSTAEFDYAIGEGDNYAVIIIDFVDESSEEPVSFAWKVNFEETITSKEAVELISENDSEFEAVFDGDEISSIDYLSLTGDDWLSYSGTDMSDWVLSDTNINLENEDWYGIAKGASYTRRPFIPIAAEENLVLDSADFAEQNIKIYPNPTTGKLFIQAAQSIAVKVYSLQGKLVLSIDESSFKGTNINKLLDVSSLSQGIYILRVSSEEGISQHKFIKN